MSHCDFAIDVNCISFLEIDTRNTCVFARDTSKQFKVSELALTHDDIAQFSKLIDDIETRFAAEFVSKRIIESTAKLREMMSCFKALLCEGDFITASCNRPHTSIIVGVDGTLQPCFFLPAIGKLGNTLLHSAMNNPETQALRRASGPGSVLNVQVVSACSTKDWQHYSHVVKVTSILLKMGQLSGKG